MFKKLCILLIYSILEMVKPLIYHQYMHNLYTIFSKILKICKQFGDNLINEKGNIPRRCCSQVFRYRSYSFEPYIEAMGIDSESNLFIRLSEYKDKMPNLISRRQYNDRRKTTSTLCDTIRKRIAEKIDGGEEYFCIDSKPIEVCRVARGKRCKMGRNDYSKAPSFGYCASQKNYYYGYKLHAICGLSGVIHSFDLTKASVHDINYLKNIKYEYHDCSILGDRGYISKNVQLDLFETANIRLEVPYRLNQRTGVLHSSHLLKPGKESKRISHNYAISS